MNIDLSKTKRNGRLKGAKAEYLAKSHFEEEKEAIIIKVKEGCFDFNNMPENWLFPEDHNEK